MTVPLNEEYLSCDWGTSSFRLRWVSRGEVREEVQDDTGCRTIFERGGGKLFQEHLQSHLERWRTRSAGLAGRTVPLLISGMASSSIGWKELPYASAPVRLDGVSLRVERLEWDKPSWVGETLLVSGVATATDMMRGEETEAVGLMAQVASAPSDATLLLPGTHSKHLRIVEGALVEITTYMTGELFEVLARHSILRASLGPEDAMDILAFEEGVASAHERGLGAALFQTRVRQVLRQKPPAENAAFLSGVLIGAELCDLLKKREGANKIFLGGVARLRNLYRRALRQLNLTEVHPFSEEEIQQAVPLAHGILLRAHLP